MECVYIYDKVEEYLKRFTKNVRTTVVIHENENVFSEITSVKTWINEVNLFTTDYDSKTELNNYTLEDGTILQEKTLIKYYSNDIEYGFYTNPHSIKFIFIYLDGIEETYYTEDEINEIIQNHTV